MFDLDHFKHINDTQGHRRGDAVLVEFATFLRSPLGKDETVVRLGGDEFMVVLVAPAGRLSELEHWYQDHAALSPSAFSMGAAINTPGEPVADTIQKADSRLYRPARACVGSDAKTLPRVDHARTVTQAGAWSLAFSCSRTQRSTPASFSRSASTGFNSR
jgi:GGDEF domain-containing protein